MPTVRVNDCDLHYEDAGEGRPVLFIHGLWGSGRFFHHQLSYFSQRYRTILLDLRGHGVVRAHDRGPRCRSVRS